MKKRIIWHVIAGAALIALTVGCGKAITDANEDNESLSQNSNQNTQGNQSTSQNNNQSIQNGNQTQQNNEPTHEEEIPIQLTSQITELADSLYAVEFTGDDGFEEFLASGGASSDAQVIKHLSTKLLADFNIFSGLFGCSTISVATPTGERLFGRNFDWENCEALVISSKPDTGYASISTVNMDFITQNAGGVIGTSLKLNNVRTLAALYAPLDGMNEMGLSMAVNMIQDTATINQNTDKPDLTTTTAIRLLLNKAANVDEAIQLLQQYDMHASMGMMMHFALADREGNSVVVEYIDNEMVVTNTNAVTNFYLTQGEKYGIGSAQSHERYDILIKALADNTAMDMAKVKDTLNSVSKDNFDEFASTEWSIVFNLDTSIAHYYHRENYEKRYTFKIN